MMARAYLLLGVSVVLLALTAAIASSTGTALAKPAWASTTDGCLSCHEPGISDSGIYLDEHDGAVGQCLVCHLVPGSKIHGTWGDTADACARCHRTHTAAADGLLIDDADNLCLFCHGSEPGNAQTNVSDGRLRYNDGSLRGGGFQQATMNTGTNAGNATDSWQFPVSLATANPTTSTHSLGISAGIWGSGSINGTAAIPFENTTRLECISCHDPHEFSQTYRMLRKQPVDSAIDYRGSTEFAFVTDQLAYASVNISSGILAYDIGDYTEVDYAAPDVYSDNGTLMMVSFPRYASPATAPKYSQQLSVWCASCHQRYHAEKDGHIGGATGSNDSGDAIFSYRHKTGDAMTSSNTSSSCGYDGTACHDGPVGADLNRQLSCLGCHVAHGTTATMTPYAQIPWPGDNATTDDGLPGTASANYSLAAWNWDGEWNTRSSLLRLDNRGVCQNSYCHPKGTGAYLEGLEQGMDYGPYTHVEGEESDCAECHRNKDAHQGVAGADCSVCHAGGGSGGCTACHGAPPATGAHAAHFGGDASPTAYGGTNNLSNATDYAFDCGTCHPVSPANHLNGSVDIELYNASAPEGSLKSLNPPTASYTLGTCSDVYCHSKTDWSSPDAISSPLLAPDGNAMLDANGNLVYDPYVVTVSTVYTSIGWNDGPRDCNGCHRNNPQTAWPDVQASVGNTHGWISDWGWEDLHAWVHGFEPIPCRSCHNSTVAEVMTYSRDAWDITYFDDAAIANKVNHVNGVKDVVFDPVNPVVLRSSWDLSSTTYDLETKVCSSVPCHLNQPNPEWGKPYRWGWGSLECDQCHRYGGPWPPVVGGPWPPSASGSAATQGIPSSSTLSAHQQYSGQNCLDCHQRHGPRQ